METKPMPATALAVAAHVHSRRAMTEEGANAYVKENPRFLRDYIKEAIRVRKNKSLWTDAMHFYSFIGVIFTFANRSIISEYVPMEDFQAFIAHLRQILSKVAESQEWIKSRDGRLKPIDALLLNSCSCACRSWEINHSMLTMTSENSGFGVLAKLCAAREVIHTSVAQEFVYLVFRSLWIGQQPNSSRNDIFVVLQELEACGALAQTFRAIVAIMEADKKDKVQDENEEKRCLRLISMIEDEPRIVMKKLRPGTMTGDVLKDIVEKSVPLEISDVVNSSSGDQVMKALRRLHKAAVLGSKTRKARKVGERQNAGVCSYCMQDAEKLKFCGRCHLTACKYSLSLRASNRR